MNQIKFKKPIIEDAQFEELSSKTKGVYLPYSRNTELFTRKQQQPSMAREFAKEAPIIALQVAKGTGKGLVFGVKVFWDMIVFFAKCIEVQKKPIHRSTNTPSGRNYGDTVVNTTIINNHYH